MSFPDWQSRSTLMILTLALGAATLGLPDGGVRVTAGIVLMLALPGVALMRVVDPNGVARPRAIALVPGFSLALAIVVALPLALAGVFNPLFWSVTLTTVILGLLAWRDLVSYLRPTSVTLQLSGPSRSSARSNQAVLIKFAAAAALWGGVLIAAGHLAGTHREFRVTEFWMVPDGLSSEKHTLGIRNLESEVRTYVVDIYVNEKLVAHWPDIKLDADATWVRDISVPSTIAGAGKARAELFVNQPAARHPILYRTVWSTPRMPGEEQSDGVGAGSSETVQHGRNPSRENPGARGLSGGNTAMPPMMLR